MAAALALVSPLRADNDSWLIVPGKSIGKVSLGMPQAEVFKLLGTPTMQNDSEIMGRHAIYLDKDHRGDVPVPKETTQSDWTTPLPLPHNGFNGNADHDFMCDFVTVYIRAGKVVQIEVRAPRFHTADGLSVATTGTDWLKKYAGAEEFACRWDHPSASGIPATKHFAVYEDARQAGVSWRYTAFGDLAPDPDPDGPVETVAVHVPGDKILVDPDGGSRFVWKDDPISRGR